MALVQQSWGCPRRRAVNVQGADQLIQDLLKRAIKGLQMLRRFQEDLSINTLCSSLLGRFILEVSGQLHPCLLLDPANTSQVNSEYCLCPLSLTHSRTHSLPRSLIRSLAHSLTLCLSRNPAEQFVHMYVRKNMCTCGHAGECLSSMCNWVCVYIYT